MPYPAVAPKNYDRRHAVSVLQDLASKYTPPLKGHEKPFPGLVRETFEKVTNSSLWVPQTVSGYAPILDHGIRSETRGVVIHVNAGYYHGTIGFFTNGLNEPYGSQGVGAHFEIGGRISAGELGDGPPYQFLPLNRVAWHAVEANGYTIGIEQAGFGNSTAEWEKTHYNVVGNTAYRTAWILRRYNLGPPHISLTNPNIGNIWPHSCGGLSWGGHQCPGPFYPWQLFEDYCNRAYRTKWGG